ncbi:putative acetyltransferase [Nitrobacteraceae bacterium AZCC 1564]
MRFAGQQFGTGRPIVIIRQEQQDDHATITDVTAKAFADVEHSDQTEPAIIAGLRAADALSVSLVAIDQGEIVGHIAFSPVTIDGNSQRWFGLGPVSVRPDRQGEGIGASLVRHGLDQLRVQGAAGCVVLGNPAYYRRFGFEQSDGLQYEGVPPEYFMRLCFDGKTPTGRVDYHPAFAAH